MANQLKAELAQYNPEELRTDMRVRKEAMDKADEILQKIAAFGTTSFKVPQNPVQATISPVQAPVIEATPTIDVTVAPEPAPVKEKKVVVPQAPIKAQGTPKPDKETEDNQILARLKARGIIS